MLLKELEVLGFKSFADKTKIAFSNQVSGVVGPNGCGKSNVLDSMKWVLGEKSVKTMRGEKMEDVIFAGTSTRKAANFAQVSLTFDNRLRLLKIDTDDVKVGRRLYRDGQSQYFINDSRVALKEIEDLFRDTGIGKSSYSFMEQGRMDQILSSKPEDRRLIFEEAAGISRFKAQREEAEKNLENTQLNLTRVEDIQRGLERELKTIAEQAKKTAEYNALMAKYKDHDLKIRYLMVRDANEKLDDLKEKLSRRHAEKEKIQQKLIQMQERLTTLDEDERNLKEELHKKDVSSQVANEKIAQLNRTIEEQEGRKTTLAGQLAGLKEQITRFEKRIKELKNEAAEQNQFTLKLDLKVSDIEKEISRLQKRIDECAEETKAADEAFQKLENDKKTAEKNLGEVSAKQEETIRELLVSLKNEKNRWEKTAKNRDEALQTIEACCEALAADPGAKSNITKIREKARVLAEMSRGLYEILFEKGGVHSRKEELDEEIAKLEKTLAEAGKEQQRLVTKKQQLAEEASAKKQEREKLLGDVKSLNVQITSVKEKEKNLAQQITNEETNMGFVRAQFTEVDRSVVQLTQEQKNLVREVEKLKSSIEKESQRIAGIEKDLQKVDEKRRELVDTMKRESGKTDEVFVAVSELEGKIGAMNGTRDLMLQNIYNDYALSWQELSGQFTSGRLTLADEKDKLTDLQRSISALGQINQLAIEQHRHIKEMYDHQQAQVDDILKARADIEKVMLEIQQKSETLFSESFAQINNNFADIFGKLFNGGQARLELLEPDKPLTSGIEIEATPPGKKTKSMRLMSGGEKAMTAIALMFAIYMVRSSPFCVLDEIDAPLDEQNVGRFLTLLDTFAQNTQFILITHNKKTMGKADVLYGVTMNEPGVSTLLSVELKKATVG